MYCGKKSDKRMKYVVFDKKEVNRDFCSDSCLTKYYALPQSNETEEES